MIRLFIFSALLLSTGFLSSPVIAQDSPTAAAQARVFKSKMFAVNAGQLKAGNLDVLIWGVRQPDNLSGEISEKGRIFLDDIINNQNVECQLKEKDGMRVTAQCSNFEGQDIGLSMLRSGYVSAERSAVSDSVFEQPYLQAEKEALKKAIGLWGNDQSSSDIGQFSMNVIVITIIVLVLILSVFGLLVFIIMRGFRTVIASQEKSQDILERERKIRDKERSVVASMLDAEIKANKSKIDAYIAVYEEMMSDLTNPQRQPKYKKVGDIVQSQPSLERAVFDRNTDKMDILDKELSAKVIHFYAQINAKPNYVNLEPDTPIEEAKTLVQGGIETARLLNKYADQLLDGFQRAGLSVDLMGSDE
ncbi:MAG: thermonuclease family protein [Bdellovibrionales bacterium]